MATDARPGGPTANRQPSPEGLGNRTFLHRQQEIGCPTSRWFFARCGIPQYSTCHSIGATGSVPDFLPRRPATSTYATFRRAHEHYQRQQVLKDRQFWRTTRARTSSAADKIRTAKAASIRLKAKSSCSRYCDSLRFPPRRTVTRLPGSLRPAP
jgi:hypothetical protein